MTLDEATETIISIKHVCRGLLPPKEQEALSLGIEALKKFKLLREHSGMSFDAILPGETKE